MTAGSECKRGRYGWASLFVGGFALFGLVAANEITKETLRALVDDACDPNDWRRSEEALKELSRLGPRAAPVLPELVGKYLNSPTYPFSDTIIAIGEPAAAYLIQGIEKRSNQEFHQALQLLRNMGPKAVIAVPDLARLLRRDEKHSRRSILQALAAIGPGAKEALPALLEVLSDQDWMVQEQTDCALAVLGPVAIPPLVDSLAWKDSTSRARAARVLETMGPGAWTAVLSLREALGDPDPHVRVQAAQALVAVDDDVERALPVVLAAFPSLTDEHHGLVAWLGQLGPRAARAVPTLIPLLDGPHPLRTAALGALAKIDPEAKAAVPILAADIAKDPSNIEAAVALWSIDRRPEALRILFRGLESIEKSVRARALSASATIRPVPPEVLPVVVKLLTSGEDLHQVLAILAKLGPAAKGTERALDRLLLQPSKPELPRLEEWLPVRTRLDALYALWKIGGDDPLVVRALMDVLDSKGLWDHKERGLFDGEEIIFGKAWSSTPWDVSRAASILGEIGPAAKEAALLLHEALSAANRSIRTSAAVALWRIEGDAEATVLELLRISAEEFPPFSRSWPFGLGGTWGDGRADPLAEAGAQAISPLIEALDRPEPQLRARAAGALGAPGPVASEVLAALSRAARDPDIRVASAAIRSLRRLGPEGRKALERALPSAEMLTPRKRK